MDDTRQNWDALQRQQANIEKLVRNLGLHGDGKYYFCPDCQPFGGTTPELLIHGETFHCYKCGACGDLVGLVKLTKRCALEEAIAWLAEETRTPRPQDD